jgi:hypothetical protein
MGMTTKQSIYKVQFYNKGELYEIYARNVYQGGLYGFVEVEELLFGERSSVVVDPAEEKLKNEFASVKRTHIPMHSIVRIDEVEKEGISKISEIPGGEDNIAHFPMPGYGPPGDKSS